MTKKEYDQQAYNKKWVNSNEENKMYKRKMSYLSTSRTFINRYADKENLLELKGLIENKLKEIE